MKVEMTWTEITRILAEAALAGHPRSEYKASASINFTASEHVKIEPTGITLNIEKVEEKR